MNKLISAALLVLNCRAGEFKTANLRSLAQVNEPEHTTLEADLECISNTLGEGDDFWHGPNQKVQEKSNLFSFLD